MAGYNKKGKYTEDQVEEIFKLYNDGMSKKEISIKTGIHYNTILNIIECKTKAYQKYQFMRTRFSDRDIDYIPSSPIKEKTEEQLKREKLRKQSSYQQQTKFIRNNKPQTSSTKQKDSKKPFQKPEIKKADRAYDSPFTKKKERKLTKFETNKRKAIELIKSGISIEDAAELTGMTPGLIESFLIGDGLINHPLYDNTIITRKDLDNFKNNIIKIGDEFTFIKRYIGRNGTIVSEELKVKIISKSNNFACTDKGDYQYIDLYKAYIYDKKKQSTSL